MRTNQPKRLGCQIDLIPQQEVRSLVSIDSLKDTREKEWKETTKFKAIADEYKRFAKKHFKTYMKARTKGRRTKNAYVKQMDEIGRAMAQGLVNSTTSSSIGDSPRTAT
ncbi:hypothetical protein EJ08DRAFT_677456 [Tothia fuscella]|uniref:Uncharacterized protein n=1 Tax=Tothia fuscella TaxID=1048955 RepID=A0A9P4U0A2_9PEZI|nr:hypothetical protein EJ08DRAFT_677456 [Tothia fuscella]